MCFTQQYYSSYGKYLDYAIRQYKCEYSKTNVTRQVFRHADYLEDSAITFDVTLISQTTAHCAPFPKEWSQGQHETAFSKIALHLISAVNTREQKSPPLPHLLYSHCIK
jgi:hypothetical protein